MESMVMAVVAVAIVIGLTLVSDRIGLAPSLVLMVVGVALSFIPALSGLTIDPAWILEGILPPLLYAAAVAMPTVELRRDFVAVGGLAVFLVVVTAVVLGLIIHWLLPDVPLLLAIGVGAILSPTDAAATTTIKRLGVPGRVGTILQGESLLNDASALVLLRATVAVAGVTAWQVVGGFFWAAAVAAVIGIVIGWLGVRLRQLVSNPAATTAMSFVIPFAAFLPAELLNASGLVAAVAAGITAAQLGPHRLDARQRTAEHSNWHTIAFLLEGAVFLAMGLELASLIRDIRGSGDLITTAIWIAAGALGVTLLVRAAYLAVLVRQTSARDSRKAERTEQFRRMRAAIESSPVVQSARAAGTATPVTEWTDLAAAAADPSQPGAVDLTNQQRRRLQQLRRRVDRDRARAAADPTHEHRAQQRWAQLRLRLQRYRADVEYLIRQPLGAREGALLTWAGMRGVVTLAAAQTLPVWEPHRSLLILIAFMVAAGSLLIQGGTIPLAIRWLGLAGKDAIPPGERARLHAELSTAAKALLDAPGLALAGGQPYDPALVSAMAERFTARDQAATAETDDASDPTDPTGHNPETDPMGAVERPGSLADISLSGGQDLHDQFHRLQLACLHARRERLLELRSTGAYSARTLSGALAELDADEVSLQLRLDG